MSRGARVFVFWACILLALMNASFVFTNDNPEARRLALATMCLYAVAALAHWVGLRALDAGKKK